MKTIILATTLLIAGAQAQASRSVSVKLDNPVYKTAVIESFQQRRVVPIFVSDRPAVDFVEIKISDKFEGNTLTCKVLVDANIEGTIVNTPASKSSSTVAREDKIKFCSEFLKATLKTALSWVL